MSHSPAALPTSPWRLDGGAAQLDVGPLTGTVALAEPCRGLTGLTLDGAALDGWLLGVDLDDAPSDAYVRGSDLVATYRESRRRPFTAQIYWSARAVGPAVILDTLVSIQTRQWEAYPGTTVSSSLPGATLLPVNECAVALRPQAPLVSYGETVRPGDFAPHHDAAQGATRWTFQPQFMERGVIRRLAVRGVVVPRADDAAAIACWAADLVAAAPPLTA